MTKTSVQENNEWVYFQPEGIKPEYCEIGIIHETDKDHIWYLDEPCKILISEVKIIPKENVFYDAKNKSYKIKEKNKISEILLKGLDSLT